MREQLKQKFGGIIGMTDKIKAGILKKKYEEDDKDEDDEEEDYDVEEVSDD